MEKIMSTIEKYWKWTTLVISIFTIIIGGFVSVILAIHNQDTLIENTAKLAQKSIIWNRDIPKVERAEVCDLYLSSGYDSYTKKLCENVILNDSTLTETNNEGGVENGNNIRDYSGLSGLYSRSNNKVLYGFSA